MYPDNVPCWYSIPEINGLYKACVSTLTLSITIKGIGARRVNFFTKANTTSTRCLVDGGSQPSGRRRLLKRGLRCLNFRDPRLLWVFAPGYHT